MPNLFKRVSRYMGVKLLHLGGIGRLTPRVNHDSGGDTDFVSPLLMSDFHYITHPVEASGGSQGGRRGGYTFEVDYNLNAFEDSKLPNITLKRMIRLLKDNNALISQSLLNFRQFVTYGYRLDGTPRAVANIEKILEGLAVRRKPLSLMLSQLAESVYVGGGAYTEIVLAKDRMTTIDFIVNDPLTAKFYLEEDDELGEVFRLAKVDKQGRVTSLDGDPTIMYLPVNGEVGSPFGKPFLLAAIFPAVWQLLLLKDIRDVLRTQVYPFVHVKVDLEKVLATAGGDQVQAESDAKKSRDDALEAWRTKGSNTAIATGDEVEYSIISGLNRMQMGMLDPIIDILNGQVASGASMMPLFLGVNDSTTETNADVQWLIEIAIIRSVQRELNWLMSYNFNIMNQAAGVGGEVVFTLLTMNAMERLREANIFGKEEEALGKLIEHLSLAFAEKIITMDEMVDTYLKRRELVYMEN